MTLRNPSNDAIVLGGKGQVGSAIVNIIKRHGNKTAVVDLDLRPKAWPKKAAMHVCIPYSDGFVWSVKNAVHLYEPSIVIVHSTVPVGTTRKIGAMTAHSPVRGQHDKLEWSLLRFIKYVAGTTPQAAKLAFNHLTANGFPAFKWGKPEDTELMKLLCLSRYLNDLGFYEKAQQLCAEFKVSPGLLMNWTDSYNDGYANTKYVRPAFGFPRGKVGGHCVMPVSKMLFDQTKDPWLGKNIRLFHPVGY